MFEFQISQKIFRDIIKKTNLIYNLSAVDQEFNRISFSLRMTKLEYKSKSKIYLLWIFGSNKNIILNRKYSS